MKEKSLRLRLVVRRHGLPEVRVLFNMPLDHDPTVAKLVELVNDAIPLEGGDWGLEDYAVELRDADGHAFECLHYQLIAGILDKDDEVFIRPLLSDDLKRRRLSGRYQITSDGRHLIDGVPYGRPLLKRPLARPAIHITPRKKRRLLHDNQLPLFQGDEGDAEPLLLTQYGEGRRSRDPSGVKLRARFEDADDREGNGEYEDENGDCEDEDSDYEDGDAQDAEKEADAESGTDDTEGDEAEADGDSEPAVSGSPIGNDELRALREDLVGVYDVDGQDPSDDSSSAEPSQDQLDLSTLDKITALRAAFPSADVQRCEKTLNGCGGSTRLAYNKLAKSHNARLDLGDLLRSRNAPRAYAAAFAGPGEENEECTGSEADSVVRHFDEHGFPPGSIQAGTALSYMARARQEGTDALPLPTKVGLRDRTVEPAEGSAMPGAGREADSDDDDATSSSGSSSGSESDLVSDDGGDGSGAGSYKDEGENEDESGSESESTDGDDSDGSPEEASTKQSQPQADSDTSSSGRDSSDDDSDSGAGGKKDLSAGPNDENGRYATSDSEDSSSGDDPGSLSYAVGPLGLAKPPEPPITAPAQASKQGATPRPPSHASPDAEAKTEQTVPPGRGLSRTQKRNARRKARKLMERATGQSEDRPRAQHGGASAVELDALKRRLLERVGIDPSAAKPGGVATRSVETIIQPENASSQHSDVPAPPASSTPVDAMAAASPSGATPRPGSNTTTPRRARFDLGAGRRMLFGALGIRNPKTKEAEDEIRAKLMAGVRPHINPRAMEAQAGATGNTNDAQEGGGTSEDNDMWREKIVYRAVECCHEGVGLSEPPFPFVQRWDVQQQGRGGKRKQQDDEQLDAGCSDQHSSKKLRSRAKNPQCSRDCAVAADIELNYDDTEPVRREDNAVGDAVEENQSADVEDLPSLPEDVSSLPNLHPSDVKPGMVITWRNWLLSKATNWQPQVSNLTAVVTKVHDDDDVSLELLLARRDRYLDRNEKVYDADGKRVYDRFEAPDLDDEDDANVEGEGVGNDETGYRTLAFGELEDPRIVQEPIAAGASVVAGSEPADGHSIETARSPTTGSSGHLYFNNLGKRLPEQSNVKADGETCRGAAGDNTASCGITASGNGPVAEDIHDSARPRSDDRSSERGTAMVPARQSGTDGIEVNDGDAPAGGGAGASTTTTTSRRSPRRGSGSPARQLEEGMFDAAGISLQASGRLSRGSHPYTCNSREATTPSEPVQGGEPSREDCRESVRGTPAVEYPILNPPASSESSIQSGRQPNHDYSVDMGNGTFASFDDTIDASAPSNETPAQKEPTAKQGNQDHHLDDPSRQTPIKMPKPSSPAWAGSSSSSVPSLSDIFLAGSTSRKRQSPSSSELWPAIKPRKPTAAHDERFEMRELEENDGSQCEYDTDGQATPVKKSKFPSTQDGSNDVETDVKPTIQTFDASVSQPVKTRARRARQQKCSSQSTVPDGSQVVDLRSSSPEPEFPEHYAEDSMDETYDEPKGLPRGDERVQKLGKKSRRPTRIAKLPASSAALTRSAGPRRTSQTHKKMKTGIKS